MFEGNVFQLLVWNPAPAENCAVWFGYSGSNHKPGCNNGSGSWVNSGGWYDHWAWSKTCEIPVTESTQFSGEWRTDVITAARFDMTLPAGVATFHGRDVWETAGSANDTCHFIGSLWPEVTGTSEGATVVNANNQYRDDIGFRPGAIDYYRSLGLAPCGATVEQDMVIDCNYGNPIFKHNTIHMSFNYTTATSSRDGVVATTLYITQP
jgi:hypothetical protein